MENPEQKKNLFKEHKKHILFATIIAVFVFIILFIIFYKKSQSTRKKRHIDDMIEKILYEQKQILAE